MLLSLKTKTKNKKNTYTKKKKKDDVKEIAIIASFSNYLSSKVFISYCFNKFLT
ncbi:hypothetical protein HMPREF9071_1218 [Capnocytophaga sp. oral taxon 338 str. F0234]|nr:hypothetical protein HMPREF9071_1218 [Capnocytophaga sp. oral taxon 338 str. F0234]